MKLIILLIFTLTSSVTLAKNILVNECVHLQEISESQFVLFNKKEFIKLGECLAVHTIKRHKIKHLPKLCAEVIENEDNPFGIMSLSKLETIYIGQCIGTINYIYQRYDNELVNQYRGGYRYKEIYACRRGLPAAKVLINHASDSMSRNQIKNLLCEVQ